MTERNVRDGNTSAERFEATAPLPKDAQAKFDAKAAEKADKRK